MLEGFNWQQFISAFVILFAVIDITGSIPIILNLKKKGKKISASRATIYSALIFFAFFYVGEGFLRLFNLDISSFAIAGSLIIFIMALEMIFDISIIQEEAETQNDATLVPLVFPLIAGAGALTTMLTIRAQFASINIFAAIIFNMIFVYFVLKMTRKIEQALGTATIYALKKFFGIILLAISIKLFLTNLDVLLKTISVTAG